MKRIPKAHIEWLVDRMATSTPAAEVEADIRRRAQGNGWSDADLDRAVAHALKHHRQNQELYYDVRTGRIP